MDYWPEGNPALAKSHGYDCETWRCPRCAAGKARVDGRRLQLGMSSPAVRISDLVWGVLTIPRAEAAGMTSEECWKTVHHRWRLLYFKLRYQYGVQEYFWSKEAHGDGRPHLNFIVQSERLADELRARPPTAADVRSGLAPHWFRDLVCSVGWGHQVSLDLVDGERYSPEYVAAYTTKVDPESFTNLTGEVAKLTQSPILAPLRTRRVGGSKGLFPKLDAKATAEKWTGKLVQAPLAEHQLVRQSEARAEVLAIQEPTFDPMTGEIYEKPPGQMPSERPAPAVFLAEHVGFLAPLRPPLTMRAWEGAPPCTWVPPKWRPELEHPWSLQTSRLWNEWFPRVESVGVNSNGSANPTHGKLAALECASDGVGVDPVPVRKLFHAEHR